MSADLRLYPSLRGFAGFAGLFLARARGIRDPEDRNGGPEMTNKTLADRVVQLGRQHPSRTPGRRAAGMVYVALITTRMLDAARRALGTFGEPAHRAAAARLFDELRQESPT